ncbi:MAG: hypothetical protein J3K34DRAFT_434247 [Monoraphidium minutum]|nr:MAG: hypothetical protein J3K34DRAFT_434247 [Monoraphidium minutum]
MGAAAARPPFEDEPATILAALEGAHRTHTRAHMHIPTTKNRGHCLPLFCQGSRGTPLLAEGYWLGPGFPPGAPAPTPQERPGGRGRVVSLLFCAGTSRLPPVLPADFVRRAARRRGERGSPPRRLPRRAAPLAARRPPPLLGVGRGAPRAGVRGPRPLCHATPSAAPRAAAPKGTAALTTNFSGRGVSPPPRLVTPGGRAPPLSLAPRRGACTPRRPAGRAPNQHGAFPTPRNAQKTRPPALYRNTKAERVPPGLAGGRLFRVG